MGPAGPSRLDQNSTVFIVEVCVERFVVQRSVSVPHSPTPFTIFKTLLWTNAPLAGEHMGMPVKQQLIPIEDRKPKVIIVGAGIAGLTVAHELVRTNRFEIQVLEKRSAPGGKARTTWTSDGFREHSMRVLPGSYVCMHQILQEIETEHGTAIDRLRPVRMVVRQGNQTHQIDGNYESTLGLWRYFRDALGLLWFLKRAGVSLKELIVFIYRTAYLLVTPERRVTTELSRLRFSEYLGGERPTPGYEKVIFRIGEILVAAKSYASAAVVTRSLLEWFLTPFLRGQYVRRSFSEFDSPTSNALIEPWCHWLEQHGVQFRYDVSVRKVSARAGRVEAICAGNALQTETIEADAYVLAVQHNLADALLGDELKQYIPDLENFTRLGEEWAHSVQFRIAKLEGDLKKMGARSFAVVDSPWSIGMKVYSKESWTDYWERTELGDDEAILTATISNAQRPGIVHGLPLLRCNKEQILEEVLAQTGLAAELTPTDGDLGLDIEILDAEKLNESDYEGYAISAVGGSGKPMVFLSDSLMYIRLPGNLDIEPQNATGVYNLFLAGEYTRTNYRIPTMEKSCESGKRCAQALFTAFGVETDPSRVPQCKLPLGFLRWEVFWFGVKVLLWLSVLAALVWLLWFAG